MRGAARRCSCERGVSRIQRRSRPSIVSAFGPLHDICSRRLDESELWLGMRFSRSFLLSSVQPKQGTSLLCHWSLHSSFQASAHLPAALRAVRRDKASRASTQYASLFLRHQHHNAASRLTMYDIAFSLPF